MVKKKLSLVAAQTLPAHLQPVRQQLSHTLRSAMLKCFPLAYTTDIDGSKAPPAEDVKKPKFDSLVHLSQSNGFGNKPQFCDYFSCSPQLIFDAFVSKEDRDAIPYRGYYGLPEAREVAQDLIA